MSSHFPLNRIRSRDSYSTAIGTFSEALILMAGVATGYSTTLQDTSQRVKELQPLLKEVNQAWTNATGTKDSQAYLEQDVYDHFNILLKRAQMCVKTMQSSVGDLPTESSGKNPLVYSEQDLSAMRGTLTLYSDTLSDQLQNLRNPLTILEQLYQMHLQMLANLQEISHDGCKVILMNIRV